LSELPESRVQGYMREYHTYLRHREAQGQPTHDYLDRVQSGVTRHMRTILVSWLYEVAHEYDLMPSTLYMTVNLLDRALSALPFHKDR
jgi:cyclin A